MTAKNNYINKLSVFLNMMQGFLYI